MATEGSARDVPFPPTIDEHLGERLQDHEAEFTTKLADSIERGIHLRYQSGEARRDVHARATGILKAQFRVHDNLPPHIANKGIFVPGKTYDAILRLSNASGDAAHSDKSQDGRGFAIKLLNVPGPKLLESDKDATTQDFVMINHPIFFSNDTKTYLDLINKSAPDATTLQKLTIPFTLGLKGTLVAGQLTSGKIGNPLQVQYFSAVPFQLGLGPDRIAVKYSAKPVIAEHEKDPIPHAPAADDYLHQAIKRSLSPTATKPVEFKFMIQQRVGPHMDVEDSMKEWSQNESPFEEVATITIPPQDVDSEELNKLGERLSFNPWHSLPDHRPLGSVNRTRKVVYERISRVRDEMNSVPRQEPSTIEG
ncbi:hypothetical protein BG015_000548 [Linnemannia schmuckeri]|uniref:Catalase core domain-containing protein n=1 Tax=Linnemannia schmuckeri TaxID=64567 RepID=A0A9P5S7K3_9FUNG|nr:hypothetical protein BG015_000548 [Linnemannia schmuckeri]